MGTTVASLHVSGKTPVSHSELNIASNASSAIVGRRRSMLLCIASGPSETSLSATDGRPQFSHGKWLVVCRVLDSGEVHGARRTPDLPACRVRTIAAGATTPRKCSANFISDLRRVHDVSLTLSTGSGTELQRPAIRLMRAHT